MEVVVTGTGRCGTRSAAVHYGIGHEQIFTAKGPLAYNLPDSSWMAAPYLKRVKLPVIHLVRNPLDVINSLVGIGFFDDDLRPLHGSYRRFAERWCPQAFKPDRPLRRACRFYLEWDRTIDGQVVRIEDLTDTRLNTGHRAHFTWDDIPELVEVGTEYGYI
jgi:hypothetical protein